MRSLTLICLAVAVGLSHGSVSLHLGDPVDVARFALSKTSNIETTVSITNVFSRNNIFYVNRIDNTRVYQLPIFPSANVTWNF